MANDTPANPWPVSEACPICTKQLRGKALVLAHREEDDRRVCFLLATCDDGHGPYRRWADRPDDPLVEDRQARAILRDLT